MKTSAMGFSVVIFALACAVRWCSGQNMEGMPQYDQRYDYLDVDGILDSKRLVRNYVDCLINVKPCTPEGKALKRVLPEALRTKCARCSQRQQRVAVKVIHRMKTEYPQEWAKLAARWDPSGDFSAYFEHVLAKEHFNGIAGNNIEGRPSWRPVNPPPPPPPPPQPAATTAPEVVSTPPPPPSSPRPLVLNRFGDDDDDEEDSAMPAPSNARQPPSVRPVTVDEFRPTAIPWDSASASPAPSNPTRFTFRPAGEMTPLYTTTATLIDRLGDKFIKTTELVAEILRSTVKALGG